MATYTPEQLGIKPPPGGFQTGGWYQSRQFWNGTLSDPGSIHPQSNQPGAGAPVNPTVVAATNLQQGLAPGTNEAYIKSQQLKNPQPTQTPKATGTLPTGGAGVGGTGASGAGTGAGIPGLTPSSPLNLPTLYNSLYQSKGIPEKETRLTDLEKKYLEARGKISDNPFLSASMIDQRLKRLDQKYQEETLPLKNEVAMTKADIETQLNLQTKQFDIDSQAARDALSYFNTLLEAGALDGASGEDIANLTRSTGLSSTIIQSAITSNKAKNVNSQVITSTDDSGRVTVSVINSSTGEIIKQTDLGQIGNVQNGSTTQNDKVQNMTNAQGDVERGATLKDLINHYSTALSVEEIYRLYNSYSPYHQAKETLDQAKQGLFYSDFPSEDAWKKATNAGKPY